jgi:regulator of protease activity HflC (stomatin/prohibitin superfamily)
MNGTGRTENDITGAGKEKGTTEKASGVEAIILYVVIAGIMGIAVSSIILIVYGVENPIFLGMGIMGSGIVVYIVLKIYRTVPQKQEWVIEIFGRYYTTWDPGLHFLIPGIMTVRGKVTVDATKMIRIFMRGDEDKLDFDDDSAEVTVEIRARATESYKPTYEVIFTSEEIMAIEDEERKKGNVPLPEYWMYLLLMRVEAALRGVCGGIKLDDAIKSIAKKTETGSGVTTKLEVDKDISREVESIVDAALKGPYGIDVEEILIRNIKLHKDTEKARRDIHLAKKGVKVEEQVVLQEKQKALQEEQKGDGVRGRLEAIVKGTKLTRGDAMDFEIAKEAVSKVRDVTVIGTGEDRGAPSRIGAEFGAGFGATYKKQDKKRGDEG